MEEPEKTDGLAEAESTVPYGQPPPIASPIVAGVIFVIIAVVKMLMRRRG